MTYLYSLGCIIFAAVTAASTPHTEAPAMKASPACQPILAQHGDRYMQTALENFVRTRGADIGIAVITDRGDTVCVNNSRPYPMNSVMKLYQAVAVADEMQRRGHSLDSVITVDRNEMDEETYSPMRRRYPQGDFRISIADLLRYSLQQSDNNACDILSRHITGIAETDRYIRSLGISGFAISATEADMHADTSLVNSNWNHPLAAAMLINRLFTGHIFNNGGKNLDNRDNSFDDCCKKDFDNRNKNFSGCNKNFDNRCKKDFDNTGEESDNTYQRFLTQTLNGCTTGENRLSKPLLPTNAIIGHKTGTGFTSPDGHPQGINDVGFVRLPNGRSYSIAVFVKSSSYGMEETERLIAEVSEIVWRELF